ncbi:MAG: rod shape-determining protein RodA [Clostridium sp.]
MNKLLENFKINSKLIKNIDFGILIVISLIVAFGLVNIYSAIGGHYAKLQFYWFIIGLIAVYFILTLDYVQLLNYAPVIYWAAVVLLLVNDITGKAVNGANAWISIGSRAIQPGEFAKIGMILMVAKVIEDAEGEINNVKILTKIVFYAAIPMILIVIQPDMGLTMVSFFIMLGIVIISNLNWKIIVGGLSTVAVAVVGIWNSPLMKPYWKLRFLAVFNPEKYAQTEGLQLIQSKIAIGSGGIFGMGFMNGKQYKFVPENHTDFIFAVIGEEWGLIGALVLMTLYGILLYKLVNIAKNSKDIAGSVIVVGVVASILFSIIQNIGMTIGLLPISGITLPFVSYGGSSMLTYFISLGLALNIGMRKNKINF